MGLVGTAERPIRYFPRKSMAKELQVLTDFYDLSLYMIQRIEKFPRHHRYSLGTTMEQRLQTMQALLVRAKYLSAVEPKLELLATANVELEVLRFQVRLAHDLKALATHSHGHTVKLMEQVGVQVGGWLKSLRARQPSTS